MFLYFIYFYSNKLSIISNIHTTSIGLLVAYSLPSLIILKQSDFISERFSILFLALLLGILGYNFGIIIYKFLLGKVNYEIKFIDFEKVFFKLYQSRIFLFILYLTNICIYGLQPMGLDYADSVNYRNSNLGTTVYFENLFQNFLLFYPF